jgi:hypothetical protein
VLEQGDALLLERETLDEPALLALRGEIMPIDLPAAAQ